MLFVEKGKGSQTPVSEYAKYLEFGTSKMAARPFIEPTMEHYASDKEHLKDLAREAKKDLEKNFGRKVPVYFRFYTSKKNKVKAEG